MAVKTLDTLVKLHKRRVDVLFRERGALEEEKRQLLAVADALREEYAREIELATSLPQVSSFFASYSKRVRQRQEDIKAEVVRLDAAIEEKIEATREEFSEQKKYEIAREHAKKRLAEEARRRQQQRFDEIGAQQHLKKEAELS